MRNKPKLADLHRDGERERGGEREKEGERDRGAVNAGVCNMRTIGMG